MKINNIIQNKNLLKSFSLICLFIFLFIILVPSNVYGAEEDEKDLKIDEEIRNPFYDYRKDITPEIDSKTENNTTSQNKKEPMKKESSTSPVRKEVEIKIEDKRIEPSFYWQGLILKGNKYEILLEFNNETHIIGVGDKLDGYQIINIDLDKITLTKDDYIYYLNMGRE